MAKSDELENELDNDTDYNEGDRIDLPEDWYMELVRVDRGLGKDVLQGFVFRPDGKDSASLEAALGLGHLTGDYETPVPINVRAKLQDYYEDFG